MPTSHETILQVSKCEMKISRGKKNISYKEDFGKNFSVKLNHTILSFAKFTSYFLKICFFSNHTFTKIFFREIAHKN